MTITIDVPAKAEPQLQRESARTGIAVRDLVRNLIEERYTSDTPRDAWERLLLSGGVATSVSLSDEQTRREFLWEDR